MLFWKPEYTLYCYCISTEQNFVVAFATATRESTHSFIQAMIYCTLRTEILGNKMFHTLLS